MIAMNSIQPINPILWKSFDQLFCSLSQDDCIAIYHDADPDGTCSAVLLTTAILRKRGRAADVHLSPVDGERFLSDEALQFLCAKKVTVLFTTDIALDEHPEQVQKAAAFARVIIIDHHKLYADLNNKQLLLLKPQLLVTGIEPAAYCSSKLVYDLCIRHVDLTDKDWIAAVGVISDMAAGLWQEFLQDVFKKYQLQIHGAQKSSDWFATRLGKISTIISSAEVYDAKNVDVCYDLLSTAKSYKDIFASKIVRCEQEISAEIRQYLKEMKDRAEFYADLELMYYQVQPRFNIKSPLCTLASLKYPHHTVLLVSVVGDRAHVSARRQDKKIAMNDLLEQACKNFPNANAGGHIPAAGATFPVKYLESFKKNIFQQLKQWKNLNSIRVTTMQDIPKI